MNTTATPVDLNSEAWAEWLAYRKAIKRPLKEPSWPLAQKKMASMGDRQLDAVHHSIANGWQGLWCPREERASIGGIRTEDIW